MRRLGVLTLILAGCSAPMSDEHPEESGESGDSSETGEPEPTGDEPLPPLPTRPDVQTCRLEGTAADAVPRLVAGPSTTAGFADAVQILAPPSELGASGLWVVESSGRISAVVDGEVSLVVDLGDRVDCCASRGLLAATLGPGPELFVHYHRADDPLRTRVARLSVDPVLGVADPQTELTVLEVDHANTDASGGALAFDAAGMLLVGLGDDSATVPINPSSSPARDRMDLRGKLLRLDVSQGGPGYAIPLDNPYVDDPDARPELFAWGFHDPRTCHTTSGRTWCSDAGTGTREELDALIPGDFGWPIVEGFRCAAGECELSNYLAPHADYGLDDPDAELEHCRITAGFAYADAAPHASLAGVVLFGDRCSGRSFGLRSAVGPGAFEIVAAIPDGLAAIGPDAAGDPWIVDTQGRLARLEIAPGGEPGTLPSLISQTECFAAAPDFAPGPDLVPYAVASPLWSDGLLKRRYMIVPPGERVEVRADGRWVFPEHSVLIKTFVHEAEPGDPSSRRAVETRFMVRRNGAWEFHTYRWREDQLDAELLANQAELALVGAGPDGGPAEFTWTFPDEIGCRNCHGFAGGRPLGPITAQLNRDVRYADGPSESQLAALIAAGLVELDVPEPVEQLPALADPRDLGASLHDRARAYFQANCAHCHRPEWMRPDLRATTPLAETGLCQPIEFPSPWVPGQFRVVPGEPEASNLWLRMGTRGDGQMPPLGTATVDPFAHALVGEWIASLSSCD